MTRLRLLAATAVGAVLLGSAGPVLAAGPYPPPSKGTGQVVPSRIKVGECAVFSGDGFAPLTPVAVADNGAARGTATTNANGEFSVRLCYASDAERGRHDLTGTGRGSQGDSLTVYAMLIVEGARQSANNPTTKPGGAASGPSTGGSPTIVEGTTGAVEGPPPGDQVPTTVAPAAGENSGTRLIMLALTGVGFAFLASLILLLLARRRRRREEDGPEGPDGSDGLGLLAPA